MQSPEEFILDYLRESDRITKRRLDDLLPFCEKFYTNDCTFGVRVIKKLKEKVGTVEQVVSVSEFGNHAEVMTVKTDAEGVAVKLRYRLRTKDGMYAIQNVDLECPLCHGTTEDPNCSVCNGSGWHDFLDAGRKHRGSCWFRGDSPLPPTGRY